MNPLLIETILKEKKLEAKEHANHCRLVNLYNRSNPGYIARATLVVGKLLVKLGTALEKSATRHLTVKEELCHDRLQP
ncbi:MAG: hypothetical protein ACI8PB_000406 [Desulforhopalus sp.]|jgi:hypothetical protein